MPNKINPPWRHDEDDALRKLWNENKFTAQRIGELLGRPRNSVIGRAHRLRVKEGGEAWPMKAKPPPVRKNRKTPPKPVKLARKVPEKLTIPAIPDKVTTAYSPRCHWTDCTRPKDRGHYCTAHANVMYQPQRDTRR